MTRKQILVFVATLALSFSAFADDSIAVDSAWKKADSRLKELGKCLKQNRNDLRACRVEGEFLQQASIELQELIEGKSPLLAEAEKQMLAKQDFHFTHMASINDHFTAIRFRVYVNAQNVTMLQLYDRRRYSADFKFVGEQPLDFVKTPSGDYVMNYVATFDWSNFSLIFEPSKPGQITIMWKQDQGSAQSFEL